ncbi:MAG: DUF4376 domain-containing protein [Bacteroidales bacterium]|jgi:hypothetical protein|nr:DUF4376 domain-containing protein [Bacteroidales bacterium]
MKYFATFSKEGQVIGHYIDEIHKEIPQDAVEMSKKEWEQSCQGDLIRDIKNKKWTTKPKPSVLEILNNQKISKKLMINNIRDEKIKEGVSYSGYIFDTDDKSFANLNETLTILKLGIPLPENFTWRTKDNQNIPVNEEFLIGLTGTLTNHKFSCYKKSWELKDEIDKAKTLDEINKINW